MAFIETQFPLDISFGSTGGPGFMTDVIVIGSGYEQRNVRWPIGRYRYNVAYGAKTQEQIEAIIDFFQACQGRGHGFRYKDWVDYKSCVLADSPAYDDQTLGNGDGAEDEFQLLKQYTKGSRTVSRTISKPVSGTVVVGVGGVQRSQGDSTYPWSVDTTTGIVTFTGTVPPLTSPVTTVSAGFEFDVPSRFDIDQLQIGMQNRNQGHGLIVDTDIPVVEILI